VSKKEELRLLWAAPWPIAKQWAAERASSVDRSTPILSISLLRLNVWNGWVYRVRRCVMAEAREYPEVI